jgi:phosphoadenylyl-sulfate reductase (thioredoxin)
LENFTRFEAVPASEILSWAIDSFGDAFGIATSFQKEGMVILDLAHRIHPAVRVFTLDTGRLPDETYSMIETVRRHYGIPVEITFPEREDVENLVLVDGPNLFFSGVPARQRCCDVRKVRPLERKLATLRAWATGLRRDQSETRTGVPKVERGPGGRVKICPLADWTAASVEEYIALHGVPVHPLYARGYTSIGCAPCTRAIQPGESERAGRWWWEDESRKECGIHFAPDGRVSRNIVTESEQEKDA